MKQDKAPTMHPAVLDLQSDLHQGRLDRRTFLRLVTLLGTSVTTAYWLTGCRLAPEAPPASPPVAKRGGRLKIGSTIHAVSHPAQLEWVETTNQFRNVAEYLTETGPDNLTRPWLLESWETDNDVMNWTLHLRRGITFNNGQPLTADDVIFNFNQWLDPAVGSSMQSLLSYLDKNNIEKVDDYTIRLYLSEPQIGLPEHLFHYPAMILPHTFDGDFIREAVGTGPFMLAKYVEGEYALFRQQDNYWRRDAAGQRLPYLDELIYVALTPDERVAAMQAGLIDTLFIPRPTDWQELRQVPGVTVHSASTAQTFVLRMRCDEAPWQDERVRQALKLCQDRQKMLDLTYFSQGQPAIDAHVAPIHPAYCPKPIPGYDPRRARALLAEAGFPDGLTVTLTTKNDQGEPAIARALKEMAAPGGFDIQLNIVEPTRYWEQWTSVNLGITTWAHRPLDTMTLALAYTADAQGKPAPWNETHWQDAEFRQLLREAERTLDVEHRRQLMCRIEDIMQARGPIGISYWRDSWTIIRNTFQNVRAHPAGFDLFYEVWQDA